MFQYSAQLSLPTTTITKPKTESYSLCAENLHDISKETACVCVRARTHPQHKKRKETIKMHSVINNTPTSYKKKLSLDSVKGFWSSFIISY